MATEMTRDQTMQALRLLRVLAKSIESVERSHKADPEKESALAGLWNARRHLENPIHNASDVHTYTLHFLGVLSKEKRVEVAKAMKENGLGKLTLLGARSPASLQKFFVDLGVSCPLAFLVFNEEYQREKKLIAAVPPRMPLPASPRFFAPSAPAPM